MTDRIEWFLAWIAYRMFMVLPLRFTHWLLPDAGIYAYTDSFNDYQRDRVSFLSCKSDEKFDWDGFFDAMDNEASQ